MINDMKQEGDTGVAGNEVYIDESGVITHVLRGHQTREDIVALRDATLPLIKKLRSQGKKVYIFVDVSAVHNTNSTTRNESKKVLELDYDALAILGNRYLQPIVAYVLRISGVGDKVRYFSKKEDALKWLRDPIKHGKGAALAERMRGISTSGWIILLVVALAALSTFSSWRSGQDRVEAEAQNVFETEVSKTRDAFETRMTGYQDALIGFQGLFHSSDAVDEEEFIHYFETVDLETRYPGFSNVSYATRVTKEQRAAFLAERRADDSYTSTGNNNFKIIPDGDRPEYYVVTFLGLEKGSSGKGIDLYNNQQRREALIAARDSGEPRATTTTQLLDTSGNATGQKGFLLSVPIYDSEVPPSQAERRTELQGFINAIFDYKVLMGDIFASQVPSDLHIKLTDSTGTVLYEQGTSVADAPRISESQFNVGGQQVFIRIEAPHFYGVSRTTKNLPWTIAFSGGILATLLLSLFIVQVRARQRAVKLADAMTEDLQQERDNAEEVKNKDEAILSSIGDGVFAIDEEGKIILFNATAERLSGYTAEEAMGKLYSDVLEFRTSDKHEVHKFIDNARAGQQSSMPHGTLLVRKDGSLLAVADSAAPVFDVDNKQRGVIVVFRDVTDQERFEKALKESNERFELAARATSDVVYDLDIKNGTMDWNDALYAAYGFKRGDGDTNSLEWWTSNIHPEDVVKVTQSIDNLGDEKVSNWTAEYRFRKADGSYVFVRDRAFVLRNKAGEPIRLIGSMLDITQQKMLEQAKDEFISIVSHQLRTPLTAIRLFNEMLAKGQVGKLNEQQQDYTHKIGASTDRMIRLVGDILNVSRIELGRIKITPESTDINALIQSHIDEMQPVADEKKVKLIFEPDKKIGKVMVDPLIYSQMIHNLLTNAVRYTKEGVGRVMVTFSKEKDGYVLKVSDNGIGIPPEAQGRIFERFYRAENAIAVVGEGTGLGLYLIKMITDTVGGSTWFETEQDNGTTFYVKLPLDGMKAKQGDRSLG